MSAMITRSRVNQPERVFCTSSDDTQVPDFAGFNSFGINFDTPILDAKRCQLLRCTIPNALVNIPNYQLTFWYHTGASGFTPSDTTLRCVRLYPQNWVGASTTWTANRLVSGGADFVTLLNLAAAAGGDVITANPYWSAGDVTFTWNPTTSQITFTGTASGQYYAPAGYSDPFVIAAMKGLGAAVQGGKTGGVYMTNPSGTYTLQPYAIGWTLNLRVGYALSGLCQGQANWPAQANSSFAYASATNLAYVYNTAVPADSFPNLVYSSCVYLYANFIAGSSLGSGKQHNLLAVIPVNSGQLGVTQYVAATLTWLCKVPDTIYNVTTEMRDDANQPYVLSDSAIVNYELAFHYREEKDPLY